MAPNDLAIVVFGSDQGDALDHYELQKEFGESVKRVFANMDRYPSEPTVRVTFIREVLDSELLWAEAHLDCNVPVLDHLMADEFFQISNGGGILRKNDVLASFKQGRRHWHEVYIDQHEVRIYHETAVVVGRWQGRGDNNGRPFDYQARYVSLWVRRDSRWQIVSDQSTEIARATSFVAPG